MTDGPVVQVVTSGSIAGGQLVALEMGKRLAARGRPVRFAVADDGPFVQMAAATGETDIIGVQSVREIGRVRSLARYLRRHRASLVHTHTPVAATILWRIAARIAAVPVVNHIHIENFYGPPGLRSSVVRRLDIATAGIPRAYIAVSEHTRASLIRDGCPEERIVTLYNSIPWKREPRRVQSATTEPIVGCIGRLYPAKGQERLIESFAAVLARFPHARLWIIGDVDGPDKSHAAHLRDLTLNLGIENSVTFLGQRPDVRDLMAQFTVLALPSLHEAFPMVLLEAMSLGVPVVATPVGGVAELVSSEVTGILVDPRSVSELTRALDRLLGDEALRESLSAAAYESVWSRFTPENGFDVAADTIEREITSAVR